jgi:hypothetical protein
VTKVTTFSNFFSQKPNKSKKKSDRESRHFRHFPVGIGFSWEGINTNAALGKGRVAMARMLRGSLQFELVGHDDQIDEILDNSKISAQAKEALKRNAVDVKI